MYQSKSMNREIKSRAWDEKGKQMIEHENLMMTCDGFSAIDEEATMFPMETIMQFTGLKDKNGKEIYEGDIIKSVMWDKPYSQKMKSCEVISQVVWSNGGQSEKGTKHWEMNKDILEKDPSAFTSEPHFTHREIKNEKGYGCYNWSQFAGCEIIGNIYENPELLLKQ